MYNYKMTNLAGAAVALVILVDLATGQGPPIYTNYLQAQQDYRPPPPPMRPIAYMQRVDYDPKKLDKEYEKAIELNKKEELKGEKKEVSEKGEKYSDKHNEDQTTAAPGVMASITNSMSDAWKSISSLGRSKRETTEEKTKGNETIAKSTTQARSISGKVEVIETTGKPGERSMDGYEYLQYKNQGYVYFKVPKYLVCNY